MNLKKTYRKVAKKYGVTVADVQRDIEALSLYAQKNALTDGILRMRQAVIFPNGVPTSSNKFVKGMYAHVRKKLC